MPTHLPSDEFLADYASGALTPGMSLLIAAHLTHAPESRARVDDLERMGGALLAGSDDVDVAEDALEQVMARLDAPEIAATVQKRDCGPLPRPVAEALPMDFDDIPWKFRLPGVSAYEMDGFADETVMLLRARPGATVPQHTHEGTEMTLIMQGIMQDQGVEYRRGDVAMNDEEDDHRPKILGDETCYCLIVQQGGLKFTGPISRILNYIGE